MGFLGEVEIPLALLICGVCRAAPVKAARDLHTGYVRVDFIPDERAEDIVCTVDVTAIEIKKRGDGAYEASAVAKVPCPFCKDVHAVRRLLERSSSVLLQLTTCSECGAELDLLEKSTRFEHEVDEGGILILTGLLRCRLCTPLSVTGSHPRSNSSDGEQVFDAFLSYSSSDRSVVEGVANALREAGLRPFWDGWHVRPGDPVQESLELGLNRSLTTVVFIGQTGIGPWQNEELRAALQARVEDPRHRVIPVILASGLASGSIPTFLRRLSWVDLSKSPPDGGEGIRTLISAVQEAVRSVSRS